MQLGRASIAEGRAIHYGGSSQIFLSSSTVEHELPCFRHSQRSPASTLCQETSVPGRASRRRCSVHISHSCFAGPQHRTGIASQLPVETHVLPFCSNQ